jgi:hypothetical protein
VSNEIAPIANKVEYAQTLAHSTLLPKHFQNNPANLLFAIEFAEALGMKPIHAITSVHVINGKPSASADLIGTMVRRAGHKLRVTGDDSYAEATLVRADDPDFEFKARWDMAKARTAGLNTATWKAYPGAMLRARAITEVCRAGAPDALHGIQYSTEELQSLGERPEPAQQPTGSVADRLKAATQVVDAEPVDEPEPTPTPEPPKDWRALAVLATGATDALRALWIDAKAHGADEDTLTHIKALATPTKEETTA